MSDESVSEEKESSHAEEYDERKSHETLISLSLYCNNGASVKRRHLTFCQLKKTYRKMEDLC